MVPSAADLAGRLTPRSRRLRQRRLHRLHAPDVTGRGYPITMLDEFVSYMKEQGRVVSAWMGDVAVRWRSANPRDEPLRHICAAHAPHRPVDCPDEREGKS
jgi:hypothetical protein